VNVLLSPKPGEAIRSLDANMNVLVVALQAASTTGTGLKDAPANDDRVRAEGAPNRNADATPALGATADRCSMAIKFI
jgi:hypothetical protein